MFRNTFLFERCYISYTFIDVHLGIATAFSYYTKGIIQPRGKALTLTTQPFHEKEMISTISTEEMDLSFFLLKERRQNIQTI